MAARGGAPMPLRSTPKQPFWPRGNRRSISGFIGSKNKSGRLSFCVGGRGGGRGLRSEISRAQVKITLREGNLDLVFAEFSLDGEVKVAAKTLGLVRHLQRPDREFEIQRIVAVAEKQQARGRLFEHRRILHGGFEQHALEFVEVRAVSDTNRKAHADLW